MAHSHRFWNWIARRYARTPIRDETSYREKIRRTQSVLRPDWNVLEFGCGTGSTALEHAPHVANIHGIDSAPRMIDICREKLETGEVPNARFDVDAIDTLAAEDGSYDAVLGMSILHLVDDRDATIGKVHRLLKPGGVFVSSTMCLEGQARLMTNVLLPLGNLFGLLPRIHLFSRSDLIDAFTSAGFEIEDNWQPDDAPMKAVFVIARKPA
ncbi:class I SAM-dependent methyltransferase [Aliiruegeria sabulilitoris]|uniref:class I SAM-dependent methyltransferase n=1 Tax=Aliiruegeria sabulilitoris TaxID=1510458 RepID=UPI0008367635|nr:class I SAM-dependent methyltransferase [Aliiruegeria sabulilitoris]NDR59665.1 class I SAM-dependent methyltransferase [Pseudoruegeria sp. M32A2M]